MACAFIPDASVLGGYPCFVLSIALVGLITFFVQESARAVSCAMGIPQSVAAITLVALGTSLPDTFASRAAALADETADNSVGNVNGSNAVNIFLGLGLPWTVGAIYWTAKGLDGMPNPNPNPNPNSNPNPNPKPNQVSTACPSLTSAWARACSSSRSAP